MSDDTSRTVLDGGNVKTLTRSQQRKKNRQDNRHIKPDGSPGDSSEGFFTRIFNFFLEAKEELGKVIWPTRKETVETTWRLLILVIIASIYLSLVDAVLVRLLGLII